jgi:hypothetical protein
MSTHVINRINDTRKSSAIDCRGNHGMALKKAKKDMKKKTARKACLSPMCGCFLMA